MEAAVFTLSNLLGSAETALGSFIDMMGTFLNFIVTNSALLIWPIISIIGAVIVYIRRQL